MVPSVNRRTPVSQKGFYIYEDDMELTLHKRRSHNAEILLVGKQGELVLQQRDDKPGITNPGLVTTFGGGLEEGETALDAAYRELHEETSLTIPKNRFIYYGDYNKTIKEHGEDWTVSYFVVKDVDYSNMKVFEGERFVVIKHVNELEHYKTSKLFREFAEDWFSGWRDFLFMPDPPAEVMHEIVDTVSSGLDSIQSVEKPILFCPVGLVGAGKTSSVKTIIGQTPHFVISADKIRTMIYDKHYNFTNSLHEVLYKIARNAAERKVNILLDTNSSSKLDLVQELEKSGYYVMVFHVKPSLQYIEQKLHNLKWETVPERFTFFKLPRHVLASHISNRKRMKEQNETFLKLYPPEYIIDPEHMDTELNKNALDRINTIQGGINL